MGAVPEVVSDRDFDCYLVDEMGVFLFFVMGCYDGPFNSD